MKVLYLFPDKATKKWAVRTNDNFFTWSNFDIKMPVNQVQKLIKNMNPEYEVVIEN